MDAIDDFIPESSWYWRKYPFPAYRCLRGHYLLDGHIPAIHDLLRRQGVGRGNLSATKNRLTLRLPRLIPNRFHVDVSVLTNRWSCTNQIGNFLPVRRYYVPDESLKAQENTEKDQGFAYQRRGQGYDAGPLLRFPYLCLHSHHRMHNVAQF